MAFTKVQHGVFRASGSSTTMAVSLTGVTAGNLIAIMCGAEGAASITATGSDGTSDLVIGTVSNLTSHSAFLAWLLSANGGNKTYTLTMSSAETFRNLVAIEFAHAGTVLAGQANIGAVDGTTITSGNISTAGTTDLVVAGHYQIGRAHV